MKILVDLVTGEGSVPGTYMAPCLLCPFMMKRQSSVSSSLRTLILLDQLPTLTHVCAYVR